MLKGLQQVSWEENHGGLCWLIGTAYRMNPFKFKCFLMLDDAVPIPPPFLKNIKKILRVVKLHMFKLFKNPTMSYFLIHFHMVKTP